MNDGNVTVDDTFVLTVSAVNDAPVAEPQSVSMSWNTSTNIVLTGSDVEGSPLTFDIVDDPAHGSLSGQRRQPDVHARRELLRDRQLHLHRQRWNSG